VSTIVKSIFLMKEEIIEEMNKKIFNFIDKTNNFGNLVKQLMEI